MQHGVHGGHGDAPARSDGTVRGPEALASWAAAQLDGLRRAVQGSEETSLLRLVATAELAHNEWLRRIDACQASGRRYDEARAAAEQAWSQTEQALTTAAARVISSSLRSADGHGPSATTGTGEGPGASMGDPYGRSVPDHALAAFMFGRFQLFAHGVPVESLHGAKPQTVLRFLVSRPGRPVSRDVLVDHLWPDADPDVGRRNLHQVVYSLRRSLREASGDATHAIVHEHDSYRLDDRLDLWVDVAAFERHMAEARRRTDTGDADGALVESLAADALYTDDYLTDALYEDWTATERDRLRIAFVELGERLNALLFERGRHTEIVAVCQRRLRLDPTAEGAHRWMMRAYAELGQRDLALQQYRHCTDVLRREWGLPPAPETELLYRTLMA